MYGIMNKTEHWKGSFANASGLLGIQVLYTHFCKYKFHTSDTRKRSVDFGKGINKKEVVTVPPVLKLPKTWQLIEEV
uniref:Restriction endonuclease subunit S n=1 Tax=Steinernema glaseri TaxID=37863 RepID=A0A1I7YLR2_9BILA